MSVWQSPLTKVAFFGGVFVVGAAIVMEKRIQSSFRQQGYYQDALQMLQKYEPAANYLGRPIYGGRLNLSDVNKFKVELVTAQLNIPVKGSKDRGVLYVLASREKLGDRWNIDQLDLEINSTGFKWKFYDRQLAAQQQVTSETSDQTSILHSDSDVSPT